MNDVRKMGRVTIPTDMDAVPETLDLLKRCLLYTSDAADEL